MIRIEDWESRKLQNKEQKYLMVSVEEALVGLCSFVLLPTSA